MRLKETTGPTSDSLGGRSTFSDISYKDYTYLPQEVYGYFRSHDRSHHVFFIEKALQDALEILKKDGCRGFTSGE